MSEFDENRVVFMGNSITEGWSNFDLVKQSST